MVGNSRSPGWGPTTVAAGGDRPRPYTRYALRPLAACGSVSTLPEHPRIPNQPSRPVAVAITGSIGAGKSAALAAFRAHGAATVSSDEIVHHLLASDEEVKAALVERLGPEILGEDGLPDRARIAQAVFRDAEKLAFLEGLLHPLASREYLTWREALADLPTPPKVCVTEVPLLYEVGGESRFDKVVLVTAPKKLREARGRVLTDDREQRLTPDREKAKKADFVYVNTGTFDDLDAWVAGVMAELSKDDGT